MQINKFFFTFLLSLLFFTAVEAKTWRVNNTPNTDADFETLLDAHAAARDGDTLHIEGSGQTYGILTITKRLIIIGPGFFLAENPNTIPTLSARVDRIILNPTVLDEPNTGAAGSEIMGLDFGFSNSSSSITINVDDVVVRFCRTYNIIVQNDSSSKKPAMGVQILQITTEINW